MRSFTEYQAIRTGFSALFTKLPGSSPNSSTDSLATLCEAMALRTTVRLYVLMPPLQCRRCARSNLTEIPPVCTLAIPLSPGFEGKRFIFNHFACSKIGVVIGKILITQELELHTS